ASAPAPTVDTAAVHHIAPQLNAAQAEAAAALVSGTRLSVIEGYAGAGKTALLQAAVQLRAAPDRMRVHYTSCSMLMATGGTTTTSGTNWPQEKQTQPLAKRFTHHDQTAHIT